jgi:hypothetical protein
VTFELAPLNLPLLWGCTGNIRRKQLLMQLSRRYLTAHRRSDRTLCITGCGGAIASECFHGYREFFGDAAAPCSKTDDDFVDAISSMVSSAALGAEASSTPLLPSPSSLAVSTEMEDITWAFYSWEDAIDVVFTTLSNKVTMVVVVVEVIVAVVMATMMMATTIHHFPSIFIHAAPQAHMRFPSQTITPIPDRAAASKFKSDTAHSLALLPGRTCGDSSWLTYGHLQHAIWIGCETRDKSGNEASGGDMEGRQGCGRRPMDAVLNWSPVVAHYASCIGSSSSSSSGSNSSSGGGGDAEMLCDALHGLLVSLEVAGQRGGSNVNQRARARALQHRLQCTDRK